MKSSDSIQNLITVLSQSLTKDYNVILQHFDFSTIDFKSYDSWSSQKYTRNCLYRDVNFEVLLLCWEEDQETAIHGHDGEDCWVYLLEGEMDEVFYTIDSDNYLREVDSKKLIPKQLSFMNDRIGFHKLKNYSKGRSMSLHVYAKPIERCSAFDKHTGAFVNRELNYDTHMKLVNKD